MLAFETDPQIKVHMLGVSGGSSSRRLMATKIGLLTDNTVRAVVEVTRPNGDKDVIGAFGRDNFYYEKKPVAGGVDVPAFRGDETKDQLNVFAYGKYFVHPRTKQEVVFELDGRFKVDDERVSWVSEEGLVILVRNGKRIAIITRGGYRQV